MNKRYGELPKRYVRYQARPGVYAILLKGRHVLLTYQGAPNHEFQLPGGGVDPGENPLHALHREVYEETGWRIAQPVRLGFYRRFAFMPEYDLWAEKLCTIYVAKPALKLGPPVEAHHFDALVPINFAEMALSNPGDRAFLEQAVRQFVV